MTTVVKTCNFNCTCSHSDCSFYHHIPDVIDRIKFKELYDKTYDKTLHNETDPEGVRKMTCKFGLLCSKEDCGFKHFSNFTGRSLLIKSWKKEYKKQFGRILIDDIKADKLNKEEIIERLEKLFPQ